MVWNLQELRSLCDARGVKYPRDLVQALRTKSITVNYHCQQANDAWKKLFQGNVEINEPSPQWNNAVIAVGAESQAAIQVLDSMSDILAQVLNKIVLKGFLPDGKVDLWKVKDKLQDKGPASPIKTKLQQLIDSPEFKYVRAFSNTVKHRSLLRMQYRIECGVKDGITFRSFSYNGESFPEVWVSDMLDRYAKPVLDAMLDIGNSINDFLR